MSANVEIPTRYLTCAETAKLVRKALKAEFPGVKFSVRSSTYAGGASIDVRWTDGPTVASVEEVTNCYRASDFNGMIDLKEPRDSILYASEDGTYEQVRYGADFISGEREYSPEIKQAVEAQIAALSGRPFDGSAYYDDVDVCHFDGFDKPGELSRCSGHRAENGWTLVHRYLWPRDLTGGLV